MELIDKYQPDILWFDNGIDQRFLDPLKLWVAAYYYNRAAQWGKQVTLNTKKAAFAPSGTNTATIGSVIDFEKIGRRSPSGIRTGVWDVDQPIGSTWGYTQGEHFVKPDAIISELIDTVSKNGTLLLNLSPEADGTINQPQQDTLLAVGRWLDVNGEAIYGTHNWTTFAEGGGHVARRIYFTVKGQTLYAIMPGTWPTEPVLIQSLAIGSSDSGAGKVSAVRLLGVESPLAFSQDASGLHVTLPATPPCQYAYCIRISGLQTNLSTVTSDGNPLPLQR